MIRLAITGVETASARVVPAATANRGVSTVTAPTVALSAALAPWGGGAMA